MAEEFQAGICGENWWMNPSKSVFMGGLSPYSTVSIASDHTGTYGSWTTADMVDLKARSISCKESKNIITTSASDTSIPFLNSQKPQQPDSDSGGSSILIDSTLQMMGFGLSSSSSSSSDWNQALLPGNGRTESYNSMMQEEMNSGGLNSSQIQKDWSPKSYTSTAEDFSLDQQRLNQVNSSTTSPQTCQGFSTGFSMEPSASYGYPSTLIQSFFDPENPQLQQAQSLFSNQIMNYLSPAAPNYGTTMAELSSPSWHKVSPLIKSSFPKQQPNSLHFTNNTPYWNASPTGINDIRANLLPPSQSQFLVPDFEEKSNCSKFTTKPSKEVRDSVSVLKKGSQPSFKRPRIETPSPLPTFKVRKEKLGDRITALQQLVSPFGKTDTASVLHEAIEYIKFLHDQVSVLSTPYMKNANPIHHQQAPADKSNDLEGPKQDLRSRGLCLVPVSSTFPVATETTADFWTPTFGGTFSAKSEGGPLFLLLGFLFYFFDMKRYMWMLQQLVSEQFSYGTVGFKDYSRRLMDVMNQMRLLGKVIEDQKVVEKMMVSLPQKFEAQTHICTVDRVKWYTKTGGAKFEVYADFDLGQNRVDENPTQLDVMTMTLPLARLEFLKMKLGMSKANLKEEC